LQEEDYSREFDEISVTFLSKRLQTGKLLEKQLQTI